MIYSIIFILALLWALLFSFVDYDNDIFFNIANNKSYLVLPSKISFQNIEKVYLVMVKTVPYGTGTRDVMLPEMFMNTLLYAFGSAFFNALAPCMMGYITAKFNFKFNRFIDTLVIITMILPIVGALPATIHIVSTLTLMDSIPGLWIMAFGFANVYYFVFKAAFKSVPSSLNESASIDGAGNVRIFIQIMLPLVKTIFLSVMTVMFVSAWNNYTTPLAFAPNKPTAAYGLFLLVQGTRTSDPTLKMTGAMILMVPILILYAFLNKKLMGNLTMGSVKG